MSQSADGGLRRQIERMPIEPTPLKQVFYSSPWLPPEWIKAHGLEPRGVWYAAESGALPLAAGVCAFAESVVQLTDKHPDAAFIFSTHCDQLRRAFDAVATGAQLSIQSPGYLADARGREHVRL